MNRILEQIQDGMSGIIFPRICMCCGREHTYGHRQICSFCLEERFGDANPSNKKASTETLLPEGVVAQHALWKFDKGGDLQHLLHQLKYHRMTQIGVDLGRKLGERLQSHPFISRQIRTTKTLILPVPLHYVKQRHRGFNQAFKIARGIEEIWSDTSISKVDAVVRTKNTRSQTGFTLEERRQNMKGAFNVQDHSSLSNRIVLVVDDVFTTGSTTFELARTVTEAGAAKVIILTIAQA